MSVYSAVDQLSEDVRSLKTLKQQTSSSTIELPEASTTAISQLSGGEHVYKNLMKLNRDISDLKKHGNPQLIDIQTLAERTWHVNLEYENYSSKIAHERQKLGNLVEYIWQHFDGVIAPLWRVEDSLVGIYEELASIRKQLESLQTLENVDSDERSAFLCQIQDRLHEIENENLLDGKFIPPQYRETHNMKIPSGQAIIMTLIQKCYRLVRVIQETETSIVSPTLHPLESKLDKIIFDLEIILGSYRNNEPVDPLELQMIQEHILAIDRTQIEGKFLDSEGGIPEGQAIIREKLEQAFDLVHECLINQPKIDSTSDDTILSSLSSTVTDARETLGFYASGISDVSLSTVHSIFSTFRDSSNYVRDCILAPLYVADSARSKMVSALRSGLGYSSTLLAKLEPVEESLRFVENDLVSIRTRLKNLRNQRVSYRIRMMTDRESEVVMEAIPDAISNEIGENISTSMETKKFRRTLEDLQNELDTVDGKRVNGKFLDFQGNVAKGQTYLQSMLDECYCLVFELLDFDADTEW
ncbi:hypothetical protein HK096_005704 [Nowakowskiella sp. JEL0078]|nr:hypothetical protein HK096_005704 [Nowakowskiella sp. JEL0078]